MMEYTGNLVAECSNVYHRFSRCIITAPICTIQKGHPLYTRQACKPHPLITVRVWLARLASEMTGLIQYHHFTYDAQLHAHPSKPTRRVCSLPHEESSWPLTSAALGPLWACCRPLLPENCSQTEHSAPCMYNTHACINLWGSCLHWLTYRLRAISM